jgi:inner membrane protein
MNSKLSISYGYAALRKFSMLLLVGLVLKLCTLPVASTIDQRIDAHRKAATELGNLFGDTQVILAPLLVVPLIPAPLPTPTATEAPSERSSNSPSPAGKRLLLAKPTILNTKATTTHQFRKRGLYEFPIFTTEVVQEGVFDLTQLSTGDGNDTARPDRSRLGIQLIGLDKPSIIEAPTLVVNGRPTPSAARSREGGLGVITLSNFGEDERNVTFKLTYTVQGTEGIRFDNSAGESTITLTSTWPHPSFNGDVGPFTLDQSDQGFTATWKQHRRSLSTTEITEADLGKVLHCCGAVAGVSFISSVDVYSMTTRAYKYELLFVVLVFTCFYLFEVIVRLPIHPIQYGLVGAALAIFFLLLLALAEHVAFWLAYAVAAATATALVTGYSRAILRAPERCWIVLCMMSTLYTFLFVVLGSEDFALLLGTTAVTTTLALLMYLTRNINWYQQCERVEGAILPPAEQ